MYICVYVCMYICICTYIYICVCVYAYMCMCIYVYMYICVCVHMCICVYVYVCSPSTSPVPHALGRTPFWSDAENCPVGAGAGPETAGTDRTRHSACRLQHWPGKPMTTEVQWLKKNPGQAEDQARRKQGRVFKKLRYRTRSGTGTV